MRESMFCRTPLHMKENFYVYILASQTRGTLYIGVTSHLIKRVYEHKNGLVDGFTKKYGYTDSFIMRL